MGYIPIGDEKLYYRQWGTGRQVLLAFPGYGNTADMFAIFDGVLPKDYTLLAFDLPHHGQSTWTEGKPLTKADLKSMVRSVMANHNTDKVSLIGYSIGGRICQTIASLLPENVAQMILIAPDGLKKNPYYSFFTGTTMGSGLFRHMLLRPGIYLKALQLLHQAKLMRATKYKFIMQAIGSEEGRMKLLQVWPCLSGLTVPGSTMKAIIRKHDLKVAIFMGAYDRVIPVSAAKAFKKGMGSVQLYVMAKGHRILDRETARTISGHLL